MKKRILLVLTTMLAVTQVWALEGGGKSGEPYLIKNSADWDDFAKIVNDGTTPHACARQVANISGVTTIIGTANNPFAGTYDGNGYTISDVDIKGVTNNVGLFGYVDKKANADSPLIENVVLLSGSINGNNCSNVGSIVGQLMTGTVQNCVNYANVSTNYSGEARCGGIIGYMNSTGEDKIVTNCMNFGHVEANRYVGGIVGSTGEGSITYCQNYGTVVSTGTIEYSRRTGGIVGNRSTSTALTNNHNGGNVNCAMGGSIQHHLIQGSTGDNVASSNTYLYDMTLTVNGTTYTTNDLAQWASGATLKYFNPTGITINTYDSQGTIISSATYSGPVVDYTLSESANNTETLANLNSGMANITLTRTLNPDGWNTFCAPFDISTSLIASVFGTGTKVRTLESSAYDSNANSLMLNFTSAESIEAGKPYLVWIGNSTEVENPTFSNVAVSNTTTTKQTDFVDFVPVMNPIELTEGDKDVLFVVGGNKLTFPTTTGNINGFRAYFHLTNNTATNARSFTMNFDDEATAISIMLKEDTVDNLAVYNLNGQRIAQPQRGLYIINGKKRIMK